MGPDGGVVEGEGEGEGGEGEDGGDEGEDDAGGEGGEEVAEVAGGAPVEAPVAGGVELAAFPDAALLDGVGPVGDRAEEEGRGRGQGLGFLGIGAGDFGGYLVFGADEEGERGVESESELLHRCWEMRGRIWWVGEKQR